MKEDHHINFDHHAIKTPMVCESFAYHRSFHIYGSYAVAFAVEAILSASVFCPIIQKHTFDKFKSKIYNYDEIDNILL